MKWFLLLTLSVCAEIPTFVLPTENDAVVQSRPNDFYMYVNRYFEGKDSKPWQAGTYGFVRNMKRTEAGVIGTRFHEGADIKPVRRNNYGVPLDPVVAVAEGVVAYVNGSSGGSNYGKYVVVRHNWGEGPICSLYAHLGKVTCEEGQVVKAGDELGILGYTGAGIDKARAHLHFEVNLMLSERFEKWHQLQHGNSSGHGNYNGQNLVGLNSMELLSQQRLGNVTSLKSYLAKQRPYYSVTVPSQFTKALQKRYPWLWVAEQGEHRTAEIAFSASGLPLTIKPSMRRVTSPTITKLQPFLGRHEDRTIGRVSGSGQMGTLTERGLLYLKLLCDQY